MMGQRDFETKLYYQLSLHELVPKDHLLRRIAERVDFSFVRPLCRRYYSHTGQPSVDPVVIFKMLLLGYLYGVTSERRLMAETQVNLAYRWFLGYDLDEAIPDHSVLSKARRRFGPEVFEQFFQRSIELCREAGLLAEGPVYVDSTLIRAGAALSSLRRREEVFRPPLSVREYLQRLDEEAEADQESESEGASSGPRKDERPGARAGRPKRPNEEVVSRTDPEATLVDRPEFGRHLAYKAHVAVGGRRGQVITAAVVTTGATAEEQLLAEVLWQHRRLSKLGVPAAVADAKYGTGPNYRYLDQLGVPAFIPTTRFGNQHTGIWGREYFTWLPEEDAYLCPAGWRLRRHSNMRGTQRVRYQAPKGSCLTCQFRPHCAPTGSARALHRSWALDLVEAAQERLAQPLGKRRLFERQTYIEGVFGLAKELHGLRRTRFKGRRRVQIQVWLTAAAMNIKKAVRSAGQRPRQLAAAQLLARFTILLRRRSLLAGTLRA